MSVSKKHRGMIEGFLENIPPEDDSKLSLLSAIFEQPKRVLKKDDIDTFLNTLDGIPSAYEKFNTSKDALRTFLNSQIKREKEREYEKKIDTVHNEFRNVPFVSDFKEYAKQIKKVLDKVENLDIEQIDPVDPLSINVENLKTETALSLGHIDIIKGVTCCFSAEGGTGKSTILLRESLKSKKKIAFISGEDGEDRVGILLKEFKEHYQKENPHGSNVVFRPSFGVTMDSILSWIKATDYEVYIIDPLSSFCTGEKWGDIETSNGKAAELLRELNGITAEGKTIIYTHHVSKSHRADGNLRTASRGSSALIDNARMAIYAGDLVQSYQATKKAGESPIAYEDRMREWRNSKIEGFQEFLIHSEGEVLDFFPHWKESKVVKIVSVETVKNNYGKVGDRSIFALVSKGESLDSGRIDSFKEPILDDLKTTKENREEPRQEPDQRTEEPEEEIILFP